MKRITAAVLLSAVSVAPAWASGQGFYVAVDTGIASFSNAPLQNNTCFFCVLFGGDSFGSTGSISVSGGYHYNQNVGVEAGYVNIDDSTTSWSTGTDSSEERLGGSSFRVAAVGTYSIIKWLDVFAKLGLARTALEYKIATVTGGLSSSGSASGSKTNLMYGFGLQFNFGEHWGMRAQYEALGKVQVGSAGAAYDSKVGVKNYSLGGVYNF